VLRGEGVAEIPPRRVRLPEQSRLELTVRAPTTSTSHRADQTVRFEHWDTIMGQVRTTRKASGTWRCQGRRSSNGEEPEKAKHRSRSTTAGRATPSRDQDRAPAKTDDLSMRRARHPTRRSGKAQRGLDRVAAKAANHPDAEARQIQSSRYNPEVYIISAESSMSGPRKDRTWRRT